MLLNKKSATTAIQTGAKPRRTLYYGYYVVLFSFLLAMFGWGLFYIYGVFFRPLEAEFNWSRAVTSGAFSLSVLVSGAGGILAGRLSDKLGPRMVIIFCAILLSIGYALMSLVQDVWLFYLIYGVFISLGVGGFWSPLVSTVARWFNRKRGLVTGIVSGGISFGTLVLPLLVTRIIEIYNWRVTYIIMGAAVLVVSLIGTCFLKRQPPQPESAASAAAVPAGGPVVGSSPAFTFSRALRTRQFWIVCLMYICFGLVQLTVMVHIVPYAVDQQISPITAAVILSLIGAVSFLARIIVGIASDRVKVKKAVVFCLGLVLLSMVWLMFAKNTWQLYLFGVIFGFGYGGLSCLQSLIAAELYGLSALGVITAVFSFNFDIGGAIGPVISGYIFDISHNYFWAFLIALMIALAGLVFGCLITPTRGEDGSG